MFEYIKKRINSNVLSVDEYIHNNVYKYDKFFKNLYLLLINYLFRVNFT